MKVLSTLPLVAVALCSAPTVDAATCKPINDVDSTFISSILMMMDITKAEADSLHIDDMLAPVDKLFPWLSQCVASMDPMALATSVMGNEKYSSCSKALDTFYMDGGSGSRMDSEIKNKLCPFYDKTVMPCTTALFVKTLAAAMEGSNGCCDSAKKMIKDTFGSDIETMATEVLKRLGNVLCSVKTFKNAQGTRVTESCGSSLGNAFLGFHDMTRLFSVLQIPTDQVCKAMNGETFVLANSSSTKFGWTSYGYENVGICYEPLASLFKMVGGYPGMSTMTTTVGGTKISMSDIFAPGKCVKGQDLVSWLTDKDAIPMKIIDTIDQTVAAVEGPRPSGGVVIVDSSGSGVMENGDAGYDSWADYKPENMTTTWKATMDFLRPYSTGFCFHLANGQSCDYGSASLTLAYDMDETPISVSKESMAVPRTSATGVVVVTLATAFTMLLTML